MKLSYIQFMAALSIFFLLCTAAVGQTKATEGDSLATYWYLGESFDLNPNDEWIPFFSLTDVPYSLPLRGFMSDTRNHFLDFGAVDWLSDWIEYRYGWHVSDYEKNLYEDGIVEQLEYLFETMTSRLAKPHSYVDEARNHTALDYVKDFEAPFQAFIPIVVMYGLNDSYEDSGIEEWGVKSETIEIVLNDAFPLVEWETDLFWFDYENATEFADLMEENTVDGSIWIDYDYLSRCDVILHDIISEDSRYYEFDMVLPTLVMLQEHRLLAVLYDPPIAIGGLGRLHSVYPEVESWNLNGRSVESYFFAGDPDKPRASITPTAIHELGHCIGQTDIHTTFGWFTASTSMSVMGAYQHATIFDRLDKDLINNGQGLQLWGRYLDELDYYRGFTLNSVQQSELEELEESLSSVPRLLMDSDLDALKLLFYYADSVFDQLASDLGESRKSEDWTEDAPALEVQIDWIIGPGIENAELVVDEIDAGLNHSREIALYGNTALPAPRYNVSIDVYSTTDSYGEAILQFWGRNMVESRTSGFVAEELPDDAFSTWPRNRVFQNQSGHAIDGYVVEQWLRNNPYTSESPDKIHYRFYIFNLENVTAIASDDTAFLLTVLVGGGSATAIIIAAVYVRRKKS